MLSPVSSETHKEYKLYSPESAVKLRSCIQDMKANALKGLNTPYTAATFIKHADTNLSLLKARINASVISLMQVPVPANILFWIYRGCISLGQSCPVTLPHICKLPSHNGEKFYVATKEDWLQHRAATVGEPKRVTYISDHAKLQFIDRVMGVNTEELLSNFPTKEEFNNGKLLEDGRYEHTIGAFKFIVDNNVCVTILNEGMVSN